MSTERPSNPYVAGPPLSEEKGFFGRQDTLKWVEKELRNPATNTLVLFGQRRIGKTSLLLRLEHILPTNAFLPIFVDLQDQAQRPLVHVLADLADKAAQRVGLPPSSLSNFDNGGRFFQYTFLPKIYRALNGHRRLVFLLDEFDVFDQPAEAELPETAVRTLFPFLRRVIMDEPYVAFVFVVGRQAEELLIDQKATFKTSLAKEIWVLDRNSTEALVRQAESNGTLHFQDNAVERILSLTSGHPYLTQLLCQRIWELAYSVEPAMPPVISATEVEAAIPVAMEAGGPALEWLWDGLKIEEKIYASALAEIADEQVTISEDRVIQTLVDHAVRLRIPEVERTALSYLLRRRILEEAGEQRYRFAVELFRRWVRKNKRLRAVKDELDYLNPKAYEYFKEGFRLYVVAKWEEAVPHFQRALDEDPRHFRARLCLGVALLELGHTDEAISELELAYQLDPSETHIDLARALAARARVQLRDGNEDAALATCDRARQIYDHAPEAQQIRNAIWMKRGEAALLRNDFDKAIKDYEQANAQEKIQEVKRRRLAAQAVELEERRQWAQAAQLYKQLVQSTTDELLRNEWKTALSRAWTHQRTEWLLYHRTAILTGSLLAIIMVIVTVVQIQLPVETGPATIVPFSDHWEQESNDAPFVQANGPLLPGSDYYGDLNNEVVQDADAWDCFQFDLNDEAEITIDLAIEDAEGVQLLLYHQSVNDLVSQVVAAPYSIEYPGKTGEYYVCIFKPKDLLRGPALYTVRLALP